MLCVLPSSFLTIVLSDDVSLPTLTAVIALSEYYGLIEQSHLQAFIELGGALDGFRIGLEAVIYLPLQFICIECKVYCFT